MVKIEKSLDHFFKGLKHTPGTWYDGLTPFYLRMDQDGSPLTIRSKSHTEEIATVWTYLLPTEANSKLISAAPDLLRSTCRTYLWMLVKFAYGINDTCTSVRISASDTLASLRNQISNATGLECEYIQDTFEQYATWINMEEDIPAN